MGSSVDTLFLLVFWVVSGSLVKGQGVCDCPSSAAPRTFHLDSILAKEATNNDRTSTLASASLSSLRAIHYRYCELPRTETVDRTCDDGSWHTRLHFHPAPICSDWATQWLPPVGIYTPIFWGASVPVKDDARCGCSQPAPAGPSTVFATTEAVASGPPGTAAAAAATSVCFSYRQQVLDEDYGCNTNASRSTTNQASECIETKDDFPTLHRLVLEATRHHSSPTLAVEYTFYDPVGPSALQSIFPSAATCNNLHVLHACVGTPERNHLAGVYRRVPATSLCRAHPAALGTSVYIHYGIQENTVLYYNGQLEGWVFVPEQDYCTESSFVPPSTSAIFQASVSNDILCFIPPDAGGGSAASNTVLSTIDVRCLEDEEDTPDTTLDAVCRGMDATGGTVFSQECVSPTIFRQQYSLCRNGVVVGTEHRVQSCYGLAGVARETYCHDTCGTGLLVCSTTTDATAACQLTQTQGCHGGVWGWVTAVGCTDARSFVSFEKLCEDGVLVGGLQTSDPVPCATNDPRFTTCHDTCPQFSVCSSANFACPQPTVPPTWAPTAWPTAFPTADPTVWRPPTVVPTVFPTTADPTTMIPTTAAPLTPVPVAANPAIDAKPPIPPSSSSSSATKASWRVRGVAALLLAGLLAMVLFPI